MCRAGVLLVLARVQAPSHDAVLWLPKLARGPQLWRHRLSALAAWSGVLTAARAGPRGDLISACHTTKQLQAEGASPAHLSGLAIRGQGTCDPGAGAPVAAAAARQPCGAQVRCTGCSKAAHARLQGANSCGAAAERLTAAGARMGCAVAGAAAVGRPASCRDVMAGTGVQAGTGS